MNFIEVKENGKNNETLKIANDLNFLRKMYLILLSPITQSIICRLFDFFRPIFKPNF